jgi:hypothetical protein
VLAMVVAGGGVTPFLVPVNDGRSEIVDIADDISSCILQMLEGEHQSKHRPHTIELRAGPVADLMTERFARFDIKVLAGSSLSAVDELMSEVMTYVAPDFPRVGPFISRPGSWAAWGLSPERSGRLFAAAARLYRSDAWDGLPELSVLKVQRPGGAEYLCRLVGADDGRQFELGSLPGADAGVALDASVEDLVQAVNVTVPQLFLRFVHRDTRPPSMLRESDEAGWTVAEPAAYPDLVPVYTAAGGITVEQSEDLIAIAAALPDFVELHPVELTKRAFSGDGVRWVHPASGVSFQYHGGMRELGSVLGAQFRDFFP